MTRKKIINILEDKLEINKNLGIRESIIRFKTTDISDLLHQLKATNKLIQELEIHKKALEYFDTLLFDHCRKNSQECFIRCDHTFERCECLKEGMWAELALKKAREEQ